METFVDRLAVALEREFGHVLGPNEDDAWRKAAAGIVEKMGLRQGSGPDAGLYFLA